MSECWLFQPALATTLDFHMLDARRVLSAPDLSVIAFDNAKRRKKNRTDFAIMQEVKIQVQQFV